jgi:hypothetical protein
MLNHYQYVGGESKRCKGRRLVAHGVRRGVWNGDGGSDKLVSSLFNAELERKEFGFQSTSTVIFRRAEKYLT